MSDPSPSDVLDVLHARARATRKHIVLSEGTEPKVLAAATAANASGLARVSVVGNRAEIEKALGSASTPEIYDPTTSELSAPFAELLVELRGHRGMTPEKAAIAVQDRLVFAALLVRSDYADGTIGGAVETTSDTVRAAIQMIGKAADAPLVSSFFLMIAPSGAATQASPLIFTDAGLVIEPSAPELSAIAAQSAGSYAALLGDDPRVAFLSFSTKGSARHERVTKVSEAASLFRDAHPHVPADGELQFDAAIVPSVADRKAVGSDVSEYANVLVFPNLDAGNIGYKIAQRLGGYTAIGPVLQGLSRPANDLSRGCTVDDIVHMIAVTCLQAAQADG